MYMYGDLQTVGPFYGPILLLSFFFVLAFVTWTFYFDVLS